MIRFVALRMAQGLISIAIVVALVFFLARLTGDPADLYVPVDAIEQVRIDFAERNGFNDPIGEQFLRFVQGMLMGDLGKSLRLNIPAMEAIGQALPTTLMLAGIVIPISLFLAVVIGTRAAFRPGGAFDRMATALALASASIPSFWLGIVGILIFAVNLQWLPSSGSGSLSNWVLPVMTLVVRPTGILVQIVRTAMINALSAPYVKTAQAKGMSDFNIILKHCLRNAMIPVITVTSDLSLDLLNGAIIVEIIFGISGIGRLLLDSIMYRDYGLLQAIIIVTAGMVFFITAITDMIYAYLDPRIRNV